MAELTANVNWIAVIVGFVVAYFFAWAWYGPLFGKKWAQAMGTAAPETPPVPALAVQAVAMFGLAWLFGVTAGANALATIILVVLTIMAFGIAGGLFAKRPATIIWIDAGYVAIMAVIMFAAQGLL